MKEIPLQEKDTKRVVKQDDQCDADSFSLGLLAHQISAEGSINALIAQPSYQDKIQILEHQTKTAMHVLNNFSHRALLADEVGLGKTIEAGIVIKEYIARKLAKRILILVPAPLIYQWQEELRSKFDEDFHVATNPDDYNNYDLIIVSIDTAKTERHSNVLKRIYWDLLVIDEAHKLKNKNTLNYKLVKSIPKERCVMLTATPLQNNLVELWNVIDLLHPGYLGTRTQFINNFIADKQFLKVKNNDQLQEKLGKIMIRNLRRDTNIYFVNRDVKTLLLDYSPEEFKFYTHVVQFIKRRYESIKKECIPPDKKEGLSKEELKKIADKYRQRGLLTFKLISLTRQITSSIKTGIKALKNYRETLEDTKEQRYLDSLIEEGKRIDKDKKVEALKSLLKKEKKKVIIFTTFLNTQKIIDEELMMMGFKTVLFNGKMNSREKENAIRRFKEDGQILITTDAGSEGRNLQFAHILINFDLPWNPMRIEQRIGRVHRIGQTKDVRIINMSINETVEAYILNRLYEKIDMFHTAIGEMDLIISQLSSKNSLEQDIFESFMEDDVDKLGDALIRAKEGAESIKEFDSKIFDKNGSRTA